MTVIKPQIQVAQSISNRVNTSKTKQSYLRDIIFKLQIIKDKEKNFKRRGKKYPLYSRTNMRIPADVSSETIQARKIRMKYLN